MAQWVRGLAVQVKDLSSDTEYSRTSQAWPHIPVILAFAGNWGGEEGC